MKHLAEMPVDETANAAEQQILIRRNIFGAKLLTAHLRDILVAFQLFRFFFWREQLLS